jgi:hypothetical protein
VTRDQLIRRLRKLAREDGVAFEVIARRGKGSHVLLGFGGRRQPCPDGELKKGLLLGLLKEFGIDARRL